MKRRKLISLRCQFKIAHDALTVAKQYCDEDDNTLPLLQNFLPEEYDQIMADLSQTIGALTYEIAKLKDTK